MTAHFFAHVAKVSINLQTWQWFFFGPFALRISPVAGSSAPRSLGSVGPPFGSSKDCIQLRAKVLVGVPERVGRSDRVKGRCVVAVKYGPDLLMGLLAVGVDAPRGNVPGIAYFAVS